MKTVTKANLAEKVAAIADHGQQKALQTVDTLIKTIRSTLAGGESLLISGFGKFEVRDKQARRGRNPVSGERITLPARRVVVFRCSRKLKEKVNGKQG